nr:MULTISPECIES: hypothetical protein [unclassified Mesorhizobium]
MAFEQLLDQKDQRAAIHEADDAGHDQGGAADEEAKPADRIPMFVIDGLLRRHLRPGGCDRQRREQRRLDCGSQPARTERQVVDDEKLQADDDKHSRARRPEVDRAVVDDGMLVTHGGTCAVCAVFSGRGGDTSASILVLRWSRADTFS